MLFGTSGWIFKEILVAFADLLAILDLGYGDASYIEVCEYKGLPLEEFRKDIVNKANGHGSEVFRVVVRALSTVRWPVGKEKECCIEISTQRLVFVEIVNFSWILQKDIRKELLVNWNQARSVLRTTGKEFEKMLVDDIGICEVAHFDSWSRF